MDENEGYVQQGGRRVVMKVAIKNNNVECFTLSNKKLLRFISIKNNQIELKRECLNLSKKFFKKSK